MANAMAASVAVGGRGLVSRGAVRGETRPSRTQSSCAVDSASLSGGNAGTAVGCSLRLGGASSSICDGATPWLQSRPIRARSSSPILSVVAAVWEGPGVVASARKLIGATNPLYAEPGTIRGDYGVNTGRNVIHGSDSPKNGEQEIGHCHSNGGRWSKMFKVGASNSSFGAESLRGDDPGSPLTDGRAEDAIEPTSGPSRFKGSLQVVGVLAAILGIGSLAALTLTVNNGGPAALLGIVSKSGFPAAFALIFVSEIGDKTFFIAALLAMRYSKWLVLLGASGALAVMTVISVIIGKLFRRVPAQLQTTLPVGEYAAVALLIWFGLRSIKTAWDIPSTPAGDQSELGELAEAEAFLKQAHDKKVITPLEVLGEAFTLTFVAEWGDRSMLATIALGASQSPWGVASGAIAGHVLATLLAVTGGALLAGYLSEKLIGYFGGFLFLAFAAATLAGVF